MERLLSLLSVTVTSSIFMVVEELSLVNLMVGCIWFGVVMKSVSLSSPCVQIKENFQ